MLPPENKIKIKISDTTHAVKHTALRICPEVSNKKKFSVIAGKSKITGCFHDFSPAGDHEHPLIDWFAGEAVKLQWNKTRKLPEWADRIFTGSMIAAGNVQEDYELDQIFNIANTSIKYYLSNVAKSNFTHKNTTDNQNY